MNKEVIIIGGAVAGGMVSNGISVLLPQSDSPIINFALSGASVFAVTKVSGSTTKDNLLKGALIGSAVVQALIGVKKVSDKYLGDKLTGTGKLSTFGKGALGLACPDESGLNGQFMGSDGQVYEVDDKAGLGGTFMDENGNLFELADDAGLNGVLEDELYNAGLHGSENGLDELYGN
jgi:hypothetical protein